MEKELVSIIMPAYNAEKYLAMSIMSVMKQTYDQIELVVVDDGSIDNTRNVILKHASQYSDKVKYMFREKNGGTAAALNDAIELATGEYICWLSADDLYADDMVDSETSWLKENSKYDAVFSRCAYIDENNNFLSELKYSEDFVSQMDSMKVIVSSLLYGNFWHGCSVLTKAECFKREDRFNVVYKASQDYDFWLRMAADYNIGYLDQVNVFLRIHSEQGSKKMNCNLDEIRVFFDLLRKEEIITKLFDKMGVDYTFENIKPYIYHRIGKYQGMEEEIEAVKEELQKYYDSMKNGLIHYTNQY